MLYICIYVHITLGSCPRQRSGTPCPKTNLLTKCLQATRYVHIISSSGASKTSNMLHAEVAFDVYQPWCHVVPPLGGSPACMSSQIGPLESPTIRRTQVLVLVSIYQGSILGTNFIFDPHSNIAAAAKRTLVASQEISSN